MKEGAGWPLPIADYEKLGAALTGVGDVDGDGISDLAVGAFGPSTDKTAAGLFYLALMKSDGSAKSASATGPDLPLSSYDYFASSLATAADLDGDTIPDGDLDGDGIVDLVAGAYGDDGEAGQDTGAVYLMFLDSDGSSRSDYIRVSNRTTTGANMIRLALDPEGEFGRSVAVLAKDPANDHVALAVGAPGARSGQGQVHVLVLQLQLGTSEPVKLVRQYKVLPPASAAAAARFGSAIAWMPDQDGDGYADIAVGAPAGGANSGSVYVMNSRDATLMQTIKSESESAGDLFGSAVALAHDYDGNGHRELLVGSPGAAGGGAVHLLFMPAAKAVTYTPASLGLGSAAAPGRRLADSDVPIGQSVTMAGRVDGDLVPDLTLGSPDYGATNSGGLVQMTLQATVAPPMPPGLPPRAPLSTDNSQTELASSPSAPPTPDEMVADVPVGGIVAGVVIGVLALGVFVWIVAFGFRLPKFCGKFANRKPGFMKKSSTEESDPGGQFQAYTNVSDDSIGPSAVVAPQQEQVSARIEDIDIAEVPAATSSDDAGSSQMHRI